MTRGTNAPPPAPASLRPPAEPIALEVDGHEVLLVPVAGGDGCLVVVDGTPAALEVVTTETTATNAGYHERTLVPRRGASAAPLGELVRSQADFEVSEGEGGWTARARWPSSSAAIYNPVVYSSRSATLSFDPECKRVLVTISEYVDTSS